MEILELIETKWPNKDMGEKLKKYLSDIKNRKPELSKLIDDGIGLIF
jgi:hypothetical protein